VREDNVARAVAVIVFTVFALSLGDAIVKRGSADFVLWQIFVVRSLIAIPCLVLFMAVRATASLRPPKALSWTIIRSLLLVSMWISYYIALPRLALSAAAATYYTLPIFITLFSSIGTGDRVTRKGWIAIALGFLGVLLILKPNAADFNWYALLPLVAAILYALAMILTRTKCRSEHPLMLSLSLNIAFVIIGAMMSALIVLLPASTTSGFIWAAWSAMDPTSWLLMMLLAVAILIGSIGAAFAYQIAPPAILGTFDFAYVGFAVLWGFLFFSEIPDPAAIVGMGLIVFAGVISLRA